MQLKLAGLIKESLKDGPGIRLAVFFQGCRHNCLGCHNPETHAYEGGYWEDCTTILDLLEKRRGLAGLTLSGGEPLDQPEACLVLAKGAKALEKNLIIYTGYTWEQILQKTAETPSLSELLSLTWLLVDGPFVAKEKDLSLRFKGSANQRVLNVAKSLAENKPVIEF